MDVLIHGLWGSALAGIKYKKPKLMFWGFIFGTLPDLLGTAPWMYYRRILILDIYDIPAWTLTIYDSTHNLITPFLIFLLIYLINKKYLFLVLPYLIHVLMDIPFHCQPIGIKLFYPFSDWSFCGPLFFSQRANSIQAFFLSPMNVFIQTFQFVILLVVNVFMFKKKATQN